MGKTAMNLFTQQNIFKQTQRGMFFDVFINFIFYHGLKRSLYPKSCGDIDIITICCPLCVIPIQFQVAYVQHLGSFPLSSSPFEIDSNTYSPIFHGSEVSEILWVCFCFVFLILHLLHLKTRYSPVFHGS